MFPVNITGVYRGAWSMKGRLTVAPGSMQGGTVLYKLNTRTTMYPGVHAVTAELVMRETTPFRVILSGFYFPRYGRTYLYGNIRLSRSPTRLNLNRNFVPDPAMASSASASASTAVVLTSPVSLFRPAPSVCVAWRWGKQFLRFCFCSFHKPTYLCGGGGAEIEFNDWSVGVGHAYAQSAAAHLLSLNQHELLLMLSRHAPIKNNTMTDKWLSHVLLYFDSLAAAHETNLLRRLGGTCILCGSGGGREGRSCLVLIASQLLCDCCYF
jgi:hypothetical protein